MTKFEKLGLVCVIFGGFAYAEWLVTAGQTGNRVAAFLLITVGFITFIFSGNRERKQ